MMSNLVFYCFHTIPQICIHRTTCIDESIYRNLFILIANSGLFINLTSIYRSASSIKSSLIIGKIVVILTLSAVSYTHLDVYKRQSLLSANEKAWL